MEEWGTSAAVEQETIRAVIQAHKEGNKFRPVGSLNAQTIAEFIGWLRPSDIRYAPSFKKGSSGGLPAHHPYTAQTVAQVAAHGTLTGSGRGLYGASPGSPSILIWKSTPLRSDLYGSHRRCGWRSGPARGREARSPAVHLHPQRPMRISKACFLVSIRGGGGS